MPRKNLSNIKLISFDLDDTLWDNVPVISHAIEQSMLSLASHLDGASISADSLLAVKAKLLVAKPNLAWDLTALRQACYKDVLINKGISASLATEAAKEATNVFTALRSRINPFKDVSSGLETLAKYWPIAAISNGNSNLFSLDIGEYFSFFISPLQAQCAKPDPNIYHYSAAHAGVAPEQILHIGDCPNNDIHAAHLAGCQTVWCNRKQTSYNGNTPADFEIITLTDLVKLLGAST